MTTLPAHFKEFFEPEVLAQLEEHALEKSIKEGDLFLDIGQTVKYMPIVVSGLLKVVRMDDNGRELLLYYLGPDEGCAMTFSCCMEQFPSEIRIVAEEDTELLMVPITVMDSWIHKYPSWKNFVMTTIRARFNELLRSIDQIAFQKLDERLITYLKGKSVAHDTPLLNLSHSQIANDLATSREVVSRLLKKLENDGKLLLYRNQIKLLSKM